MLIALLAPVGLAGQAPAPGAAPAPAPAVPAEAAPPPLRAAGTSGNYIISGIAVDVTGSTAQAARTAGWRLAQRRAWPQLWARLSGKPASAAPVLGEGALDALVAGIESEGEQLGPNRYIARLGVIFDKGKVAQYLPGALAGPQSPPFLLLTWMADGGAASMNAPAWRQAWQQARDGVTPLDYVISPDDAVDRLWLTGGQAQRRNRAQWRVILERFQTVDLLLAEAHVTHAWPGGPANVVFIARHGPDGAELGRFKLRAARADALPAVLADGARRLDALYAAALRNGQLQPTPGLAPDALLPDAMLTGDALAGTDMTGALAGVELLVATPDATTAQAALALLKRVPGVSAVLPTSLALGGTSRFGLAMTGGPEALAAPLAARGWVLDDLGGSWLLRRRKPGEVAAPPASPAPAAATPAKPAAPRKPLDLLPQ
ncbi:MAG: heavy-metal-associated domain-containing protein [Sphingomonadales bacterium]|jgi:hypothetical protein